MIFIFLGHTIYLENTYGDGYEQFESLQQLGKVNKFEDDDYLNSASRKLSVLFQRSIKPSDVSEFIKNQPGTFFIDDIKVTSGHGAFGRIY